MGVVGALTVARRSKFAKSRHDEREKPSLGHFSTAQIGKDFGKK